MSLGDQATTASPGYRTTVGGLALGQLLSWAALYYAFSSFVLPMMRELGWDKAKLMGALTLGLATWGAATYAVGAAIDRGHGRFVMTLGALLAGSGFIVWSQVHSPWALYAVWAPIETIEFGTDVLEGAIVDRTDLQLLGQHYDGGGRVVTNVQMIGV